MFLRKPTLHILSVLLLLPLFSCAKTEVNPQKIASCVSETSISNGLQLFGEDGAIPIVTKGITDEGTLQLIDVFASDIERVSGFKPIIYTDTVPVSDHCIIIGQVGEHGLVDSLATLQKINSQLLKGKWETSLLQVVNDPLPGIKSALVIAGSDKRGTLFGMFELSRAMGVSPWYWWADVPVEKKTALYIKPGTFSDGEPKVKYRGIFINDEAPALTGWAFEKYGGFNHEFYSHVFELILRHRGNYLWPAMWGRSFNYDDTLNPYTAKKYGIVMGKSHHEPLNRAHVEWSMFGEGPWDYTKNTEVLDSFWIQGMKNAESFETILSVGMRGDGDEAMSEESNVELLQNIVKRQREIMEEVSGKPAEEQPQLWALYKEVLDYYHKGMRIDSDVTLLLCDDNWGNVRYLPNAGETNEPGGYGMYYHFDYVGGPRNYKWINVSLIPRIWEQMNLTYQHGVDKIWIVNVGDIKPMELPITFFLDYAWDPNAMTIDQMTAYTSKWAGEQFGTEIASDIADILTAATKINNRRTPEMLDQNTYSLSSFNEFENTVNEYCNLSRKAADIEKKLAPEFSDAYYQLVLFPVSAMSNLYNMYYAAALNQLYVQQGRAEANEMADLTQMYFDKDKELTKRYHTLGNGKWNHMMAQNHIGYTYWQQPETQVMPEAKKIKPGKNAELGICFEKKTEYYTSQADITLPVVSEYGKTTIQFDVFNRGKTPFKAEVTSNKAWLKVDTTQFEVRKGQSVILSFVAEAMTRNNDTAEVTVVGNGQTITFAVRARTRSVPENYKGHISSGDYVSMNAEHYTNSVGTGDYNWQVIPDLGRTDDGVTLFPVTEAPGESDLENNPYLEYRFLTTDTGSMNVCIYTSPALDIYNTGGRKYAVSVDDGKPVLINMQKDDIDKGNWYAWVGNDLVKTITPVQFDKAGIHTIKFIAVDNAVVLQKITVETENVPYSYLGAPESKFID